MIVAILSGYEVVCISILAWKIPSVEEPGRLQSMGSLRVQHDWVTSLSLSCIGEGNGNPLQCSCLENPRDSGAWWAAVYRVAQSRTEATQQQQQQQCVSNFESHPPDSHMESDHKVKSLGKFPGIREYGKFLTILSSEKLKESKMYGIFAVILRSTKTEPLKMSGIS